MTVFVDSNYFIALGNANDSLHEQALLLSDKLFEEHAIFIFTNFIFAEIVTVLSQRTNRENAIRFGKELLHNKQVAMVTITKSLHDKSWEIFQKTERKNISFVDCSTLVVMEFENISTLLSFDKTNFKPLQKFHRFTFYNKI